MPEKTRIAVVDTDEVALRVAEQALGESGYAVRFFQDGASALDQLRKWKPILILVNIILPKLDGFSLLRAIKQEKDLEHTKVVMFSAKHFHFDKKLSSELGADDFFEKPFEPYQLLQKVRRTVDGKIRIRFWGVRGSVPVSGPHVVRYGGNTSCVEVGLSSRNQVIFDAGTGIRELGKFLLSKRLDWGGRIFLSHHHWDHIQGLPFFGPAYVPGNEFTILGPAHPEVDLQKIVSDQMESVYFPINMNHLSAKIKFQSLAEDEYEMDRFALRTLLVNHPGLTLAYRLTYDGKSVVYMPDNEIPPGSGDSGTVDHSRKRAVEFISGADVLIHDAQYDDAEYPSKAGWGHSTWREAMRLAVDGQVKRLILFHHDPDHTDEFLDQALEACREELGTRGPEIECDIAQEGMEIEL